ncbi:MAG: hypothetical protein KAT00_10450 [Planctomycetes bacterium]|nr:hypothetical protein [Planctomycetota bacterium]
MKRVLLIAVALMMAAPAMAIVTIVGADIGGGQLQISYTTTAGEAPRGIALAIDTGDTGVTVDSGADHVSGDAAFNTFMDWAHGDPANYNVGDGHGLANSAVAGTPAYPASQFSLSLGVLDTSGGQGAGPTLTLDLATIQLNSTVATTVNVTITADTLRGPDSGVVGSILASNLQSAPLIVPVVVPPPAPDTCIAPDSPYFALWDTWGRPDCWCGRQMCHGDADMLVNGPFPVASPDLVILLDAFNDMDFAVPPGGECGNFDYIKNGPFLVASPDLVILLESFNDLAFLVPACSQDIDGDGDDDILFWTN